MSEAIAYRLSFIPADPNIAPDECMPIYYYATPQKACMAAWDDALAHVRSHAAAGEREEAAAYRDTCHAIYNTNPHTLPTAADITFPVDVGGTDNPRRIGTYYIHPVREGDQADCMGCGDFRGIVTAIHSNGDTFSVCEDCEREQEQRERPARGVEPMVNAQGRVYVDAPRGDGSGAVPPWQAIIHTINESANACGEVPFGAPNLTPLGRVPGEAADAQGTCEWYPDYRVEHRRGADFVRIVARTDDAADLLRHALQM